MVFRGPQMVQVFTALATSFHPRAGTGDIFKDLRHTIVEIVSKHGLHNAARAAWTARTRSPFMQDKHNDDILAATKSFLQSAG